MRFANISGRLSLVTAADGVIDIATESNGTFSPRIQEAYERWDDLLEFATTLQSATGRPFSEVAPEEFGGPVPQPRQIFAIGLNYAKHAAEAGLDVPNDLTVFTKFATALTGPFGEISLPPGTVDWEVELVAVIGQGGRNIAAEVAWEHVAGLTVGQDLSERTMQSQGPAPQYSLAKSYPGFAPIGPVVVTPDEFKDPDDIGLTCTLNGEQVQSGRSSDMVFSVSDIIARLSRVTPLLPGDLIFTGTPPGVGVGRTPQRFLAPGDELVTFMEGVGEMRHVLRAPAAPDTVTPA